MDLLGPYVEHFVDDPATVTASTVLSVMAILIAALARRRRLLVLAVGLS